MKRYFTLLFLALYTSFAVHSQVILTENFTNPFNPNTNGWVIQNNSIPTGSISWTQGNQTGGNGTLTAFNGNTDDFYMADFLCVPLGQSGGISAWLITPTLTIYNGAILEFATSTFSNATIYPDRMQVRMSQTGNTVIPSGTTSVGSFTDLLLDINPNLSSNTGSVVNNGTVNGYPQAWSVYTIGVSGVTGTVTGRFAFRYFVNDGGSNGANSRLVGVDAVKYSLPCGVTVNSYTICNGSSVTLSALGGIPSTTYTWNPGGANASSVTVSPGSTTTYTLSYGVGAAICPDQTATVTIGGQLSMSITASAGTVCAGSSVTLSANSAATTYSWNTGATTQTIVVNPSSTTTYSVGGLSGTFPNICLGGNTIEITALPGPTVTAVLAPTVVCSGQPYSITGSGADSYIWLFSSTTGSTLNPTTFTAGNAGPRSYTLVGVNLNGCASAIPVNFTVSPSPTISATPSSPVICLNQTVTLTGAGGASAYAWSGDITSGNNPVTYTGTTVGMKNFTLTGTNMEGCSSTAVAQVSVSLCTGIEQFNKIHTELSLYPNPFNNELNVSGFTGKVEVYNSVGQLVLFENINTKESFNTTELSKGAYIVKLTSADGNTIKTIKMMKN